MKPKLTAKQKTFVKTFLETGVGIEAAKQAYDIKPGDENTAASMASENLRKPNIIEAIRRGQKDEQIGEAFDKLINLKRIEYFVFPLTFSNKEIEEHINAQGIEVLNIRESDRGKLAFYAIPDGRALGKALEIWTKVSGAEAPKKNINLNIEVKEPSAKVKDLAKRLNYGV